MIDPRKAQAEKRKAELQGEQADLRAVLNMERGEGRRFVTRILKAVGTYADVVVPGEAANLIWYNAGQQAVGHRLERDCILADHNAWLKMKSENLRSYLEEESVKETA